MRADVILFDINETTLDVGVLKPKFKKYFHDEKYLDTWFAALLHSSTVCLLTSVKTNFKLLAEAGLYNLAGKLGVSLSKEDSDDILSGLADLPVHGDMKPALTKLRQAGFKLVAFSNSAEALLEKQLKNAGLLDYFDETISVENAATFKPSLKSYQFAIEKLNVKADRACLVAAHDWDTQGAMTAGLQAAFVNRNGAVYNPFYLSPAIIGSSMGEVANQIINGK